jgi:cellulose synthase/poly-beta-1,6-N-acetylglucosamine synthase-like glycosyltransferase
MMLDDLARGAFWVSAALIGYSYLIYPLLLAVLARVAPQRPPVAGTPSAAPVEVACIVSAYNEERHIEQRIANFLAQEVPGVRVKVYVGSDGSRDRTAQIITRLASDRVVALAFEHNRGKASVLNDLVAASTEPVLIFSDANTMFEPGAIQALLAPLADPAVGVACGELDLLASQGNNQDSVYWRYEQYLKRTEAQLGGLLGANGAIYAIRRHLVQPLPADWINDDFRIAMDAAAAGARLVYVPQARATEDTPDHIHEEYRRRVRIGIGNFQTFFGRPQYLLHTNWATRLSYVSHKVLRWFTPHLMLVALVASTWLARSSVFYLALAGGQWFAYAASTWHQRVSPDVRLPKLAKLVVFFVTLNWAFAVAYWRYVTGRYSGSWRSTQRT